MRERKGLARTSSAATQLNRTRRDEDNQLIPIKSEQQNNLNLGSRDPFNLIDQTKEIKRHSAHSSRNALNSFKPKINIGGAEISEKFQQKAKIHSITILDAEQQDEVKTEKKFIDSKQR